MINIALPKGRLGDQVYKLFSSIGYQCNSVSSDSRKLVFEDPLSGVRYFLIKPFDVGIYVERGVADVGVIGKDVLMETKPKVYELLDLGFGCCELTVSALNDYQDDFESVLRVATKYPNIARQYYQGQNREIEIIRLNGSIELAPILGLSDVIVDIVETGSTLRENHLKICEHIATSSARLIANMRSFQFNQSEIHAMTESIIEMMQQ